MVKFERVSSNNKDEAFRGTARLRWAAFNATGELIQVGEGEFCAPTAEELAEMVAGAPAFAVTLAPAKVETTAALQPKRGECPHWTRDQGCPLHGETCRPYSADSLRNNTRRNDWYAAERKAYRKLGWR